MRRRALRAPRTVQQAARVLCSRTVKDLVVGSELRFEPRGERELRGVDEPWAVYAAED